MEPKWCKDKQQATNFHKTNHGPILGGITILFPIVYFVLTTRVISKWWNFLELQIVNLENYQFWQIMNPIPLQVHSSYIQNSIEKLEAFFSNPTSHCKLNSKVIWPTFLNFVIENQTINFTPNDSFSHNLNY